jgi:hypothetical protein
MTEEERLAELRKQFPGGLIPPKEIYRPDPVAKSQQGPLEVVTATFKNYKIKRGSHA